MGNNIGTEQMNLVAYPLEKAIEILKNMGYKVLLRELSSLRSKLYTKKCVLRTEFLNGLPEKTCIIYWASFLELNTDDTEEKD